MKEFIERFYNSIRSDSPPPIPYREIILTARIMDEIFAQIYGGQKPGEKTKHDSEPGDIGLTSHLDHPIAQFVLGHQP